MGVSIGSKPIEKALHGLYMLALDLDGQFSSETLPTRDGTLVVALETI